LIVAGVFVTDAGAGFPAGAPAGAPEMSWHGALHEVGYLVVMLSWTAACFVFRRRFAALGQRGWARVCVATVRSRQPACNSLAGVGPARQNGHHDRGAKGPAELAVVG
jgi:hypothetical protein